MAQAVKEMLIRLNGEVAKGASGIGDYLTGLGQTLDQIGSKTREFEKESVGVYRNYEDEMLAARYALSAQVQSVTELDRQMAGLEAAAQQWASTSIFHTDDVSHAINEAAHAGWTYQEILTGIPEAMLIAQAGGMDLSDGLDYLVKMMNATNTPMEKMGSVVDQWAMAANISATNIDELGQAFISMGSAAQFGDSTAELFAMLAALANVGTTGTKAGTALRNVMMRLIAPTTKAEAAMNLLGADSTELQEVLADLNVTKAAEVLQGLGFSAFKEGTGELKPIKQIFEELFTLTDGLQEGARDELLAAIFPTRTIATALSLLTASNGELDNMFDLISGSEGYAGKGADIMMSGLTGSIETLLSKWEEFERKIGETLAPQIEGVATSLGNMMDAINGLPPEVLSGLTSMLTTLSAAGPILIGAGAIIKIGSALGPMGTAAVLAGLGISYLVGKLEKMSEIEFESHFGTLTVDLEELGSYVDGLETKFSTESSMITQYSEAVTKAQENMNAALTGLNEGLLKKVLTGGTFTDDDFSVFTDLGDKIVQYTKEGITNAEAMDQTFLQAIFGDKSTTEETAAFDEASGLLDYYYQGLASEATQIGEEIRSKMTEALRNGSLTAEDRQAIQAQIDRLNAINAAIAERQEQEAYYEQQVKAGRVNWDTISGFLEANDAKLAESKTAVNDRYDKLIARLRLAEDEARKEGKETVTFTDSAGQQREINLNELDGMYAELEREREEALKSETDKYGHVSATAFDTLMRDAGYSEAWDFLKTMYANGGKVDDSYFAGMTRDQVDNLLNQMYTLNGDKDKLSKILNPFVDNDTAYAMMRALEMNGSDLIGQFLANMDNAAIFGEGQWGENGFEYGQPEEPEYTPQEYIQPIEAEYIPPEERPELQVETVLNTDAVDEYVPPVKYGEVQYLPTGGGSGGGAGSGLGGVGGGQEQLLFAEGGRASMPSIFGEAGPEWAIPEEHSERTAALLKAAAAASGFTWGDLLSRYGGLNANPNNSPVVLNYSPVIHAGDAGGVQAVLAAERDNVLRMIRMAMEEAQYREGIAAYA